MTAGPPWSIYPDAVWTGDHHLFDHAVVIADGLVADVIPAAGGHLPRPLRLEGCTLIPGLVDCHVHLADWMLPAFLAAGVTTVRDVGNDLSWILERRRRTAEDPLVGPMILCCGPVLDGPTVNWPTIGRRHDDPEGVAASVDQLAAAGVDAIKLYVNVDVPMMEAAVVAAARSGLPVLAHLGGVSAEQAVAAGIDEIEHLTGCVHHVSGGGLATALPEAVPGWTDLFTSSRVALCPTIAVWDRLGRMNDPIFVNDRRGDWVVSPVRSAWRRFPHRTSPAVERISRQMAVAVMKSVVESLHAGGCRIIAGSDAPFPGLVPGFALHDELALLVDAGFAPVDALAAATSAAADALGVPDQVGRISPGLRAVMVAVAGDPTRDILDLGEVTMVVRGGRIVDRDGLRRRISTGGHLNDPVTRLVIQAAES